MKNAYNEAITNLENIYDISPDEYTESEKEKINDSVSKGAKKIKSEKDRSECCEIVESRKNKAVRRHIERAVAALEEADYKCEFDNNHKSFIRKNTEDKWYTETHHLIPLGKYSHFEIKDRPGKYYELDTEENIVSLCSHCHNLLHYGRLEDKEPILKKLYEERKDLLEKKHLKISFQKLKKFYE